MYSERNLELRNNGVSVRGLDWKYRLDIAVRAYSKLKETNLTVLGTGPLTLYLEKLNQTCQSGVVFLHKKIEHNMMPQFFSRFGYFVAPSRTEA